MGFNDRTRNNIPPFLQIISDFLLFHTTAVLFQICHCYIADDRTNRRHQAMIQSNRKNNVLQKYIFVQQCGMKRDMK